MISIELMPMFVAWLNILTRQDTDNNLKIFRLKKTFRQLEVWFKKVSWFVHLYLVSSLCLVYVQYIFFSFITIFNYFQISFDIVNFKMTTPDPSDVQHTLTVPDHESRTVYFNDPSRKGVFCSNKIRLLIIKIKLFNW